MIRCILVLSAIFLSRIPIQANEAAERLAKLLVPNFSVSMLPGSPRVLSELKPILPGSAPAKFQGQPPRPGLLTAKVVLPHNPGEQAPLVTYTAKPIVPREIEFPTTAPIALPVVDVTVPPPVPILSRPIVDRAPLSDATLEASIAAALARAVPLRGMTVPFVPMNLPDPFELQYLIRLPGPLDEDFQPMAGPLHILVKPPEPVKAAGK